MIVHFIFFHPPFLRTATSMLAEDAPGRSRDGDRGKKSKVLGSSPVQSQQLDHSYPGVLEHILELKHSFLGAGTLISWNIYILKLDYSGSGAGVFISWSAGTYLGGENIMVS